MSPLTPNLDLTNMSRLSAKRQTTRLKFFKGYKYLEAQKASLLYSSFILTKFNYCPLIWMFCGTTTNDKVNSVHKRALRVLLNNYTSSFEELLHIKEKVIIHERNLQKLMLEIYRCMT